MVVTFVEPYLLIINYECRSAGDDGLGHLLQFDHQSGERLIKGS